MTRTKLFWTIGKKVYEEQSFYENVIQKYSDYCSYYFGDSVHFTRENIHLMKRFYLSFPIYQEKMEEFSWEQYQLLLKIPNKKERFFYYYLSILFHSNYQETLDFISNQYYIRFQER